MGLSYSLGGGAGYLEPHDPLSWAGPCQPGLSHAVFIPTASPRWE